MPNFEKFFYSFLLSILFQSSYVFKFINNPTITEFSVIFYGGFLICTLLYTLIFFLILNFLNYQNNLIFLSFKLTFNFLIFVILLRTIFFIFGVSRISDFLSNYNIIVFTLIQKVICISVLFLIFLVLKFLNRKYFKLNINRIFKAYIFVLSIVLILNLSDTSRFITNSYAKKESFTNNYVSQRDKKVFIFIFDELDSKIIYQNKDINKINFNNLINESVSFSNGITPGRDSLYSIYSMLIARDGSGTFYKNLSGFNYKDKNNNIKINFQNSFFSIYHPEEIALIGSQSIVYCIYLNLPHCSDSVHDKKKDYKRMLNFFEIPKIIYNTIFRNYLFNIEAQKTDKEVIDKIFENEKERINQISINERVLSKTKKAIDEDNFKIIYSHFPLPHHPSHFAKKILEKTEVFEDDYLTNLNLFNLVIKQLTDQIKIKNKNNDYLIIITSDHGRRSEERILGNHREVPLIVKLSNEKSKIQIKKHISTYHIGELIKNFNDGKIENHKDIKIFFETRRVYKPEMKYIDIIFKRRLKY